MRQTTILVRGLRSACAILAVAGLMAALAMPVAAQETLAGETFTGDPGAQDAFVDCESGSGSMVAMGTATGPVPGNFLEFVEYDFDPTTGALTHFEAQFTIRDADTNAVLATGTKSLIEGTTVCNALTERTVTDASVSYAVDFDGDETVDEQGTASVIMSTTVHPMWTMRSLSSSGRVTPLSPVRTSASRADGGTALAPTAPPSRTRASAFGT